MALDWKSPYVLILVVINSYLAYLLIDKYYPRPSEFIHQADVSCGCAGHKHQPLPYRDYTPQELYNFDGVKEKHILVAIDMRVFDVTSARKLYGPGGTYSAFAGRDASRSLATGSIMRIPKGEIQDYDQLLDLSPKERDTLNGWVDHYYKKYEMVGTLLPYHLANKFSDDDPDFPHGGAFIP